MRSEEENGYEDEDKDEDLEGGFFQDGAFIAAPQSGLNLVTPKDAPPDAQEAYYRSLISRFRHLRSYLQQEPPLSAIESLTSDYPISLPPDSKKAKQQWRFLLQGQDPQTTQIACMDMETILEIVKLLRNLLAVTVRSRSREKINRVGLWTWSIMGKCNEAGQLGSEEISELRELGKRAVGLLVGIRDQSGKDYGHQDDEEEEMVNGEEINVGRAGGSPKESAVGNGSTTSATTDTGGAPPQSELDMSELEHAKALLAKQLNEEHQPELNGRLAEAEEGEVEEDSGDEGAEMSVDKQIRAMLDMIITMVGELYGQRDLLEFRDIWDDEPASSMPRRSGEIDG